MRVLWIAASAVSRKGGGGAIYAEGLQRAFALAMSDLELVEIGSPRRRRTFVTWARRHLVSLACSLYRGESSAALYHRYRHVAENISALVADRPPDLTIFDSSESMVYRDLVSGPSLLVAHNIEADIIAERVRSLPQPMHAIVEHGFREIEKYRQFEQCGVRCMSGVIAISAADRGTFEKWLPGRPVVQVLPSFGPASGAMRRQPARPDAGPIRLVFPAKFSWGPNRQGIGWFIEAVWPHAARDAELHLFGEGSESYSDPARHIVGHGFVPSVAEIWRDADVAIIPTFIGSGLNIKMCEALYYGIPVLATSLAVERLGFQPTAGIFKCDGVDAWRQAVSELQLRNIAHQCPPAEVSLQFSDESAAETLRSVVEKVVSAVHSAGSVDGVTCRRAE